MADQDRIVGMKDGDVRRVPGTDDVSVAFVVTVLLPGAANTGPPGCDSVSVTEAYKRAEAVIRGGTCPTK